MKEILLAEKEMVFLVLLYLYGQLYYLKLKFYGGLYNLLVQKTLLQARKIFICGKRSLGVGMG